MKKLLAELLTAAMLLGLFLPVTAPARAAASIPPQAGEGYVLDYRAETVSPEQGYELSTDGLNWSTEPGPAVPGGLFFVRPAGSESAGTEHRFPERPAAPAGAAGGNVTSEGKTEGQITGVTGQMEYRSAMDGDWTPCGGTCISGLSAEAEYYVRFQASDSAFAGEEAAVTIPVVYGLTASPPSFPSTVFGGEPPEAQAVLIINSGNTGVIVDLAELSAGDTDAFLIDFLQEEVELPMGGRSDEFLTVRPSGGLIEGTYAATLTLHCFRAFDPSDQQQADIPLHFTVKDFQDPPFSAPELADKSFSSVRLRPVELSEQGTEAQYSADGGVTWQDSSLFTGLAAETAYQFAARYRETDTLAPSAASELLTVVTDPLPRYAVTFDARGGSPVEAQRVVQGGRVSRPSAPVRSGFDFTGWYADPACTSPWDFGTPVTAGITLFAGWAPQPAGDSGGSSSSSGGGISSNSSHSPNFSKSPSVSAGGLGGAVKAEQGGRVVITPRPNRQIETILVNGKAVEIPRDGVLTGLKETDRVSVIFGPIPTGAVDRLEDVRPEAWYYEPVRYMLDSGLFHGTSADSFTPESTMTRAMLVTVLYRAAEEPEVPDSGFPDVPGGQYYADAAAWAARERLVQGRSDGSFAPEDPITREQLAVILHRWAGSPPHAPSLSAFRDGDRAAGYALEALSWAAEQGILCGRDGGILDPGGSVTRAEAAAILMRYFRSR